MAHVLKARVAETTTSTGTGAITLAGALSGHRSFASVLSVGDTTEVVIIAADGSWEECLATYSSANTLTRTTFKDSSTGSTVSFGAGEKTVILTPLAESVGVGPTKTQTISNKDLLSSVLGTGSGVASGLSFFHFPASASPSGTHEGRAEWDSDNDVLVIGDGAGQKTMADTSSSQTLTNKTLGSGTQIGADVAGNDSNLSRVMLKDSGWDFFDSGTTNALDFTNGSHQRWAPNTGAQTLSVSNWPPSGNLGELLIEGVNLGAATITWPTVNWIKSDGTTTTTFSSAGVTLQASGTDWVLLWTRNAGTTIYGKVVR